MRRAILPVLVLCGAAACIFLGGTATVRHIEHHAATVAIPPANASAFSCSSISGGVPHAHGSSGNYVLRSTLSSSVECDGGTGNGWIVDARAQFQSSSGAWDYPVYSSNDGDDHTRLPNGGNDCNQGTHFANFAAKVLDVVYDGGSTCGTYFPVPTNDEAVSDSLETSGGWDFSLNGYCSNGVQGWRERYDFTDYGNSSNEVIEYSASSTC